MAPGGQPVSLSHLQAQATAIVAKGQIIPLLPGSALFHAIQGGEAGVREVLAREFNIGPPNGGGGGGGGSNSNFGPGGNFGMASGGGGNFGGNCGWSIG